MTDATFQTFLRQLEQDREFAERQAETKPSRDLAMLTVAVRRQFGLSQTELAKKAGVSQAYVSQLESGTANPSIRSLSKFMRRLGVNLSFEAVIAAPHELDSRVESRAHEQVESELPSEGEMYHVMTTVGGLLDAIRRSRVDQVPLTKEAVIGEVVSKYDEPPPSRRLRSSQSRS